MQLSKAIEGFIVSKQADGRADGTVELYQWSLAILCKRFPDADINRIATSELRAFFASLPENTPPLSKRSIEMIHIHVKSFFRWLFAEGLISLRPDDNIKIPHAPAPAVQPFTEYEVRRMLKSAAYIHIKPGNRAGYSYKHPQAERNRAIVFTLLSTGVRASELCNLNNEDADLQTGEVRITAQKTPYPRTVYLDNASRKALWRYQAYRVDIKPGEPLFLTDEGNRMNAHGLYVIIHAIGERAKVPNAHPHRWRHTMAVQSIINGMDLRRLQLLLGHQSIEMTQRYLQFAQPDVQAIHAATSAADRWRL